MSFPCGKRGDKDIKQRKLKEKESSLHFDHWENKNNSTVNITFYASGYLRWTIVKILALNLLTLGTISRVSAIHVYEITKNQ